jgi:hypothetical protein
MELPPVRPQAVEGARFKARHPKRVTRTLSATELPLRMRKMLHTGAWIRAPERPLSVRILREAQPTNGFSALTLPTRDDRRRKEHAEKRTCIDFSFVVGGRIHFCRKGPIRLRGDVRRWSAIPHEHRRQRAPECSLGCRTVSRAALKPCSPQLGVKNGRFLAMRRPR